MKTNRQILCGAAASAFLLILQTGAQAALDLRWLGLDMNTDSQSTFTAPVHVDTINTTLPSIASLASLPFGPGANLMSLTNTVAPTVSGTSFANTAWTITPGTDTFSMALNDGIGGGYSPINFTGREGVLYFYALTAGVISVTYDYGNAETGMTDQPYKASERGRSKSFIYRNSKGLGDAGNTGLSEIVNRDGSRTFFESVSPADDLLALAFDFRILDPLMPTSISGGYLNMTFTPTPVPEPGTLIFGLALFGTTALRRRARA